MTVAAGMERFVFRSPLLPVRQRQGAHASRLINGDEETFTAPNEHRGVRRLGLERPALRRPAGDCSVKAPRPVFDGNRPAAAPREKHDEHDQADGKNSEEHPDPGRRLAARARRRSGDPGRDDAACRRLLDRRDHRRSGSGRRLERGCRRGRRFLRTGADRTGEENAGGQQTGKGRDFQRCRQRGPSRAARHHRSTVTSARRPRLRAELIVALA